MAISSVARKATIREDRSLREAYQIVGRQQALAGRLAIDKEKVRQAGIKQRNEEQSKLFETLRGMDSAESVWAEPFDVMNNEAEDILIDPNIPYQDKQLALTNVSQFTKQTAVAHSAMVAARDERAGTAEQQKTRNIDAIARGAIGYVMDPATGKPIRPVDFNVQELNEAIDTDLATYNQPNIVEGFMNQQKDIVATEISSKNMASGFSRNDIITKASKFLVLDEAGTGYKVDEETGKPIANITGENLEAFEGYSRGNKLAIDDFLSKPANKGKTRLDGMKDVLEKNGWLTSRETREVDIRATPKPTAVGAGRVQTIASVRSRIEFFDKSLAEGGDKILSQLKSARGVVASDGADNVTGVKSIPGGLKFTVVVDPNKIIEVPREGFITLKTKEGKFMVREVDVLDSDPLTGLIELSAVFDQTVGSKFEIDPVDFVQQYQDIHKADVKDPFSGAFSGGTNPFGVNIK